MSECKITIQSHPKDQPIEHPTSAWSPLWQRITLGAIMLISVFMNFFNWDKMASPTPSMLRVSEVCWIAGITSSLSPMIPVAL